MTIESKSKRGGKERSGKMETKKKKYLFCQDVDIIVKKEKSLDQVFVSSMYVCVCVGLESRVHIQLSARLWQTGKLSTTSDERGC